MIMILKDMNTFFVYLYAVLLRRHKTSSWPSSVGLRREELVCNGSRRCYIFHLHHTPAVQVLHSVQVCSLSIFNCIFKLTPRFVPMYQRMGGSVVQTLSSALTWRVYHFVQAVVGPAFVASTWPGRWRCHQGETESFEWQCPVRHPQHDQSEQGMTNELPVHLLFIWDIDYRGHLQYLFSCAPVSLYFVNHGTQFFLIGV